MKTIAWILDTFPSPHETFIARDIAALRARGFNIEIYALRAGEGAHAIRPFGRLWPGRWRATGARLGDELRQRNIAHIHGGWASHPAEIAQAAARRAGVSWSFSAHARDLWVEGKDWKSKLASAAFASACTRAGEEFLRAQSPEADVFYAPHGLDLEQWPFAIREQSEIFQILGVGRLVEKKGWDIWLEALAGLNRDWNWRAEILGDGPQRELIQNWVRRFELEDRVALRGAVSNEQARAAMQAASVLVFAGRTARDGDRDGLPNILLEAAALGLPIVASRAGSVEEFGADAMQLCDSGDAQALADAIRAVHRNREEAQMRAQKARAVIESRFDAARCVEPLARAFGAALEKS